MSTAVRTIEHSASPDGIKIGTVQARYPRFIHAELMTHRDFSRNASSSRAIPTPRLLKDIRQDPAAPIHWGKNQPGMQANEELTGWRRAVVKGLWYGGMYVMTSLAWLAYKAGAHKQIVNRMVEPWSHINVVITSTKWANFFGLRRHADAQPEIKELADAIHASLEATPAKPLHPGEWHLPYVEASDHDALVAADGNVLTNAVKVSVARCARVSYMTFDGKRSKVEDDIKLYDKLVGSAPLHASPAEHQATPDQTVPFDTSAHTVWANPAKHGNLHGFIQFRKTLANEYIPD